MVDMSLSLSVEEVVTHVLDTVATLLGVGELGVDTEINALVLVYAWLYMDLCFWSLITARWAKYCLMGCRIGIVGVVLEWSYKAALQR